MSVRNILLVLAAVLITVGTGLVARNWVNSQKAQQTAATTQPVPAKTYVLVAQSDLPVGTFIKDSHLTWQAWPDDKLHSSYLVQTSFNPRDLVGAVVRRGVAGGEPITAGQLIKPGERGFLAAVLRPGYRAVSVQVNA
ncbi:MAG TPA: Flp pilus assembly protein CpaB, partial [Gammaproteobacteria bacterium]|nr:Flp pilus assembly protein CpaB [Gammaproteobacteria bacterium]